MGVLSEEPQSATSEPKCLQAGGPTPRPGPNPGQSEVLNMRSQHVDMPTLRVCFHTASHCDQVPPWHGGTNLQPACG